MYMVGGYSPGGGQGPPRPPPPPPPPTIETLHSEPKHYCHCGENAGHTVAVSISKSKKSATTALDRAIFSASFIAFKRCCN